MNDTAAPTPAATANECLTGPMPALAHLATAVLLLDAQLRIQYANHAAEQLLATGLSPKHTVAMGDIHAGCDRISSTPLPFSYSVLLHRAVYSFCLILPFSLSSSLGFWSPVPISYWV